MKFGYLVEICLRPHLAVKGLKPISCDVTIMKVILVFMESYKKLPTLYET